MILRQMKPLAAALALALAALPAAAQEDGTAVRYMQPPQPIAQILDTPPPPLPSVSPTRTRIALLGRSALPPIAELAEPDLRLAGYRINPRNNGPANSRLTWLNALSFQEVAGGTIREVRLPAAARFVSPAWSPDGNRLAFLVGQPGGLELWVAEAASGAARRLTSAQVNAASGTGFEWLPDSSALLVRLVPAGRGAAPDAGRAPEGPIVQENAGRTAPVRTYQDLLRSPADEALFAYYFTSQLAIVPVNAAAPAMSAGPASSPAPAFRRAVATSSRRG